METRDHDTKETPPVSKCFLRVSWSWAGAYIQAENHPSSRRHVGYLDLAGSVEVLQTLLHSLRHRFLALTDPDSGVVVLFVWLVLYRGVSEGFGM